MNYDTLSVNRKQFIDSLKYLDKPLRDELSELFIDADTWQGFRVSSFVYLESRIGVLDCLKKQLVGL